MAIGAALAIVSDHHPLWGRYVLPCVDESINTPSVKTAVLEFVKLPLTDQVIGQRFEEELKKRLLVAPWWLGRHEASGFLYSLSIFSTKLTRQIAMGLIEKMRSQVRDPGVRVFWHTKPISMQCSKLGDTIWVSVGVGGG